MNRKEISKIILILKTSYPYAFKDMGKEEIESMVGLYEEMFKENTYKEVYEAIKKIVYTSEYMPTIAAIKSKIYDMKCSIQESNMDLWEKLLIAIRNSNYHSEEEFEKLPLLVKEYIKSPAQLRELAIMPSDEIHTIIKGQFLKQIEMIKRDYKEQGIVGRNNLLENNNYARIEEVID